MEKADKIVRLIRYSAPTIYDKACYATQWKQLHDGDAYDLFIQLGDEEQPEWKLMGSMLEKAFEDLLYNEAFLNECLRLYKNNQDKQLAAIIKMIKKR